MDISDTLAPNSDQLDAVDLAASGPRVFTVKSVSKGDPEQPVQVHLDEFPRGPWRPGKNQRRVLAACWGADASAWVGRRVELYCDPDVMFGREAVGGIRIKRLSDISGQQKIPLIVSRGKSASYTVQPLKDSPSRGEANAGREPASAENSNTERGEHVSAGESPAPANRGAAQTDGAASPEPLLDAITRQIAEITEEGGGAHLKTWWASIGIGSSKRALIDRFGEDARNIRELMGPVS